MDIVATLRKRETWYSCSTIIIASAAGFYIFTIQWNKHSIVETREPRENATIMQQQGQAAASLRRLLDVIVDSSSGLVSLPEGL